MTTETDLIERLGFEANPLCWKAADALKAATAEKARLVDRIEELECERHNRTVERDEARAHNERMAGVLRNMEIMRREDAERFKEEHRRLVATNDALREAVIMREATRPPTAFSREKDADV